MAKVRINKVPKGGNGKHIPFGFGNNNSNQEKKSTISRILKPIPRDKANLEAEKDEVAMIPGGGGIPETYVVGGNRHSKGGTPLLLEDKSFVYSDTAKMKIKDEEVLKDFGLKPKKGGYTLAEIAKKFNINKYKAVLQDEYATDMQKETAEQMIKNYNLKLSKLALVQESMKGFEGGLPAAAIPYLQYMSIDPTQLIEGQGDAQRGLQEAMKCGGVKKAQFGISMPGNKNTIADEIAAENDNELARNLSNNKQQDKGFTPIKGFPDKESKEEYYDLMVKKYPGFEDLFKGYRIALEEYDKALRGKVKDKDIKTAVEDAKKKLLSVKDDIKAFQKSKSKESSWYDPTEWSFLPNTTMDKFDDMIGILDEEINKADKKIKYFTKVADNDKIITDNLSELNNQLQNEKDYSKKALLKDKISKLKNLQENVNKKADVYSKTFVKDNVNNDLIPYDVLDFWASPFEDISIANQQLKGDIKVQEDIARALLDNDFRKAENIINKKNDKSNDNYSSSINSDASLNTETPTAATDITASTDSTNTEKQVSSKFKLQFDSEKELEDYYIDLLDEDIDGFEKLIDDNKIKINQ